MISGIYWAAGKRQVNQDSAVVQQVLGKRGLVTFALIADGIGGLAEGETASGFVAETLTEWFYREALELPFHPGHRLVRSLNRQVYALSEQLAQYGRKKGIELGTTCTCILIRKGRFISMHIGDSALFFFRRKSMMCLTQAHTTEEGALSKCIGSLGYYEPDYYAGSIPPGSAVCLCTDGFYKKGAKWMKELMKPSLMQDEASIERRLRMVAGHNLEQGEQDNQTAVYLLGKRGQP